MRFYSARYPEVYELYVDALVSIVFTLARRNYIFHQYVLNLQIPMNDTPRVAVVYSRENLLHDVCSLPIVDAFFFDNKTEKLSTVAKLCYYIVIILIHVALKVFKHIRVIDGFKHSYFVWKVGFWRHVTLLDNFQSTILIEVSVHDSFHTAEGALPKRLLNLIGWTNLLLLENSKVFDIHLDLTVIHCSCIFFGANVDFGLLFLRMILKILDINVWWYLLRFLCIGLSSLLGPGASIRRHWRVYYGFFFLMLFSPFCLQLWLVVCPSLRWVLLNWVDTIFGSYYLCNLLIDCSEPWFNWGINWKLFLFLFFDLWSCGLYAVLLLDRSLGLWGSNQFLRFLNIHLFLFFG